MYRILILGSGGREHALAWSIKKDNEVSKIFCAPGNAGTSQISENINLNILNNEEILEFVNLKNIDIIIVGPEQPLQNGIVDFFEKYNVMIFGPSKFSSQLETSKLFARNMMENNNIPQPAFFECTTEEEIISVKGKLGYPLVLKADGLAAGKGVIICSCDEELNKAMDDMLINKKFGNASSKISVEECLFGEEVSVFIICDGTSYKVINSAQDHKRIFDNDKGPNTGGMGAYSPAPIFTKELKIKTEEKIIKPILKSMKDADSPYKGFLYIGLMIVDGEPYVIEFNVRLGDPEAQVILPLLGNSVFEMILASINKKVETLVIKNIEKYAVTVVLVANGYPESYKKGVEILGLDNLKDDLFFHAGTTINNNKCITNGGRVLNIVGLDENLNSAILKAYDMVNKVDFVDKYYRTDIGKKAFKHLQKDKYL